MSEAKKTKDVIIPNDPKKAKEVLDSLRAEGYDEVTPVVAGRDTTLVRARGTGKVAEGDSRGKHRLHD